MNKKKQLDKGNKHLQEATLHVVKACRCARKLKDAYALGRLEAVLLVLDDTFIIEH